MRHEHLLAGVPYPALLRPRDELATEEHELPRFATLAPGGPGTGPGESPPPPGITQLELGPSAESIGLEGALWHLHDSVRELTREGLAFPVCDWHALDRVVLSGIPQADGYTLRGNPVTVQGRTEARRLSIVNPNQVPIGVGESSGTALRDPAYVVPALSVLRVPWNANDVEIACDPVNLLAADLAPVMVSRSDRELDQVEIDRLGSFYSPGGGLLAQQAGQQQPLAIAGTYTSGPIPGSPGYTSGRALFFSDVAGNFFIDYWIAGAWRQFTTGAVAAGVPTNTTTGLVAPWWRIRYTNGAAPQTVFDMTYTPVQA